MIVWISEEVYIHMDYRILIYLVRIIPYVYSDYGKEVRYVSFKRRAVA